MWCVSVAVADVAVAGVFCRVLNGRIVSRNKFVDVAAVLSSSTCLLNLCGLYTLVLTPLVLVVVLIVAVLA